MNSYYKKIFEKYKYLFITFTIMLISFIAVYFKSNMALFFDIPSEFINLLEQSDYNLDSYLILQHKECRNFYYLIVSFIYNPLINILNIHSTIKFLSLFATSYFISHFIFLILNFIVAYRTKRYDIAIMGFAFYCFFGIPCYVWAIRELLPNTLILFIILSYFLSKIKFKKIDIVILSCFLIYLFESYETTILFGLILFAFANIYIVDESRKHENKGIKLYIGLISLSASIYMILKLLFIQDNSLITTIERTMQWINGSKITLQYLFKGNLIIPVCMLFILIIATFLYKKRLALKHSLLLVPALLCVILFLYFKTNFIMEPGIELHYYSIMLWFMYPIITAIILFDFTHYPFIKKFKTFLPNLFVLACICGILNLTWQFNSCYQFKKYYNYLSNLYNNQTDMLIYIPEDDYKTNTFLSFDTCFGTTQKTLFISKDNKIEKLLIPRFNISSYCYEGNENYYFDKEKDMLILQDARLKVKTKYWDLTPIKDKYIKEGKVKPAN